MKKIRERKKVCETLPGAMIRRCVVEFDVPAGDMAGLREFEAAAKRRGYRIMSWSVQPPREYVPDSIDETILFGA